MQNNNRNRRNSRFIARALVPLVSIFLFLSACQSVETPYTDIVPANSREDQESSTSLDPKRDPELLDRGDPLDISEESNDVDQSLHASDETEISITKEITTTVDPTTAEPTTVEPTTAEPTTVAQPTTVDSTTAPATVTPTNTPLPTSTTKPASAETTVQASSSSAKAGTTLAPVIVWPATTTSTAKPTATPLPTATPRPTAKPTTTPLPTATPRPTAKPTATPRPTAKPTTTPLPTATPRPTAKPTATPLPTVTPGPTATPVPTQVQNSAEQYKLDVLRYTNDERAKLGLAPLQAANANLAAAAQVRANEIITKFSHTRPNGSDCFSALKEANVSYGWAAENIAYNTASYYSAYDTVQMWMNSAGHRANILNANLKTLGVGYAESNGNAYISQLFIG